jgi:hypothetical protein
MSLLNRVHCAETIDALAERGLGMFAVDDIAVEGAATFPATRRRR